MWPMARAADLRFLALLTALAYYGAFGSPTPDSFGMTEILIGFLILAAIPPACFMHLFSAVKGAPWRRWAQGLAAYGLSIPLLSGLVSGHDPALIVRDIISFVFLLLPLFLLPPVGQGLAAGRQRWMVAAGVFVGLAFSLRVVWPFLAGRAEMTLAGADPLYLSIAPTVVFAAVMLPGLAAYALMRGVRVRNNIAALALAALGLFPFAAMALTLQRASLGLAAGALVFLLVLALWRWPRRALAPLVLAAAALACLLPVVADVFSSLMEKQGSVGLNMRAQEAAAVFDAIAVSPWQGLFGLGWGATFESPAVGGMSVNYTHSLLTFYVLKTGLIGVLCLSGYLFRLAAGLVRNLPAVPLLAAALAVPLAVDTLLYASYKSLDFGLILLLCAGPGAAGAVLLEKGVKVAPKSALVYR